MQLRLFLRRVRLFTIRCSLDSSSRVIASCVSCAWLRRLDWEGLCPGELEKELLRATNEIVELRGVVPKKELRFRPEFVCVFTGWMMIRGEETGRKIGNKNKKLKKTGHRYLQNRVGRVGGTAPGIGMGWRLTFLTAEEAWCLYCDVKPPFFVELVTGLRGQRHKFLLVVSHLLGWQRVTALVGGHTWCLITHRWVSLMFHNKQWHNRDWSCNMEYLPVLIFIIIREYRLAKVLFTGLRKHWL